MLLLEQIKELPTMGQFYGWTPEYGHLCETTTGPLRE